MTGGNDGRSRPGYLKKLPNMNVPSLKLDRQEIILLNIMLGSETVLDDSSYGRVRRSLRHKLSQWNDGSRLSTHISMLKGGRKSYRHSEEILENLLSAIESRDVCSTRYYAFSKQRELELVIQPIHLFEWNQGLYVFCLLEPELVERMLAVERFRDLQKTSRRFRKPAVNPEELLEGAFGVTWDEPIRVRVRFARESALYVKARRWSADQRFVDRPDGSTELRMNTSGIGDVTHWILSFGPQAEVLEPESLRNQITQNLQTALSRYRRE